MKHKLLNVLILLLLSFPVLAQKTLKGKVVDASTNSPLLGATITFGAKDGVSSDKDGMFSVDCGKTTKITVSFIGYETQHVTIKNCDEDLTISLIHSDNYLNDVEITATSNQNKALLYQPVSLTKLTPVELKRGNGLFLEDAINSSVPGVTMQRRAVSSGQNFNIRGYGNGSGGTGRISSNFDGQGYKVYLNGIPITDAEGITLMDDIDFASIGNVEITKGPAGTLYGLAAAGVVNLKTIKPEKGKIIIGQDVLVGSFGVQRYTTHFQMGSESSSLLVNYGHQESEGYTIHNNSTKNFVNVTGDFKPNSKEAVSVYLGYSKSYDQRNGELTLAQWAAKDYSGNLDYIKRNGHSEVVSFRAGVSHTYNFCKNLSNTTTLFGTAMTSNSSSAAGWTDKDPINYGFRTTLDMNFSLNKTASLSGIVGAEGQRQTAQTIGYTMMKDPRDPNANWAYGNPYYWILGASTSNKYTTSSTGSYFTEWTLGLPHDLSITAGLGLSNMRINLTDRFYVVNNPETHFDTTYKGMVSPHFAINKVFNKQVSVYFSYSKGYKAPTSSYFFIPYAAAAPAGSTSVINHGLKPEIGNQFEIGTKGTILGNKLNYQVALFDAIFSNKMTAINVLNPAGTATLYTYVANGGKQDDKGIEVLVKYAAYESSTGFFSSIKPFGNFTISSFKYDDYSFHYKGKILIDSVVNYDGKDVSGVAKFTGNIGIDVMTKPGIYANMAFFHKDGFPITSDGKNWTTAVNLLNAKLGYQASVSRHFGIDAYVVMNNLTGNRYPIMVFANQLPDAYMTGPLKANFFGGLNLKYIF